MKQYENINGINEIAVIDAIHSFIHRYKTDSDFRNNFNKEHPYELDISDPHLEDMRLIESGDFKISKLSIVDLETEKQYHFYIGKTEFHIHGKAIDFIENSIN